MPHVATRHKAASGKIAAEDLLTAPELESELLSMGFETSRIQGIMPACLAAAESGGGPMCMEEIVAMLLQES